MIAPIDLLWALIGLILTIGGTFLEAFIAGIPLHVGNPEIPIQSLGVTCQIGAVLLVACLGGRNAAAISQIAYLILGLTWLNIFTNGGGLGYVDEPTFGYLLGFVPGAWVCGSLAFRVPRRLESIAFSCICGLLAIHVTGISYLLVTQAINWTSASANFLAQAVLHYSLYPSLGQLALACAVTVLSFVLRHLMFY
ncbi:MAG: biotin transporter BioY [Elainellaceae cyanobacterium]